MAIFLMQQIRNVSDDAQHLPVECTLSRAYPHAARRRKHIHLYQAHVPERIPGLVAGGTPSQPRYILSINAPHALMNVAVLRAPASKKMTSG